MKQLVILLVITAATVIAGCGAKTAAPQATAEVAQPAGEAAQQETAGAAEQHIIEVEVASYGEGVEMFRTLVKDLKKQVEAEEKEAAAETAGKLAGVWKAIEAEAKGVDATAHETITATLDRIAGHIHGGSWDRQTLIDLDYQLYQESRKLKAK